MNAILLNLQIVAMDWSLETLLSNFIVLAKKLATGFVLLFGIFLVVMSLYQLVKAITGGGKGQPANWAFIIAGFAIGGLCLSGGWTLISNISKGAGSSIESMGTGNDQSNLKMNGENGTTETIILPFGNTTAYIDMK